ncbi:MAG: hydantoinase B/oxoprolinase family protein [bacterium]
MPNDDTTTRWQLYVDTGGTFTDALACSPTGRWGRAKVLSSGALRGTIDERISTATYRVTINWPATADVLRGGMFRLLTTAGPPLRVIRFDPDRRLLELVTDPVDEIPDGSPFEVKTGEEAPILAARLLTGTAAGQPLPPLDMRLGTTLATNALLTRGGADTALFITEGFGDLLLIGTQQRPDLFALQVVKPPSLYAATVEVPARLAVDGTILRKLDPELLHDRIEELRDNGITSVAVALLHADRYPAHEQELAQYLRDQGFAHVSCSSDLARAIRFVPRAATAVVDAYLAPVVSTYLAGIESSLAAGRLLTMTSAGGLGGHDEIHPKDLLLSGPAGGVVGAALAGRYSGHDRVLSFDMGGTSSDMARFDGQYEYVFEHEVGDAHLFAPALAIETVAAGGGSICRGDGNGLAVGPESAGASPGPACYGAGGPLTLTDVNLLLGRLDANRFGIPVTLEPARRELASLLTELGEQDAAFSRVKPESILAGFLEIANERMADAIRRISIRRGYDPVEYALVAFGGAGGQHACAIAERLGVTTVVVPADAGLLSAWGMAGAVVERFAERQFLVPVAEVEPRLADLLGELEEEAFQKLAHEEVAPDDMTIRHRLAELRFVGQETALQVVIEPEASLTNTFLRRYETLYGHRLTDRDIELVNLRVVASTRPVAVADPGSPPLPNEPTPEGLHRTWFGDTWLRVPRYSRVNLQPGATLAGPALILEAHATTVVEPYWWLQVDGAGALVLRRVEAERETTDRTNAGGAGYAGNSDRPEAVQIELFSARFEAIAREMGEALQRTAVSTNVKERLDFSCAVLDAAGELVVNAPHIPVHLGSLGLCVRAVRQALPLAPGDVAVTNHPAYGGSHLPDLTVLAPVFADSSELIGYVAARAHHAEIGGIRPGSMPPDARCLAEEGVVIPPTLIVSGGEACFETVTTLLQEADYPSRAVPDNLADLTAAVAACHQGATALRNLAAQHGVDTVARYMVALKGRASRRLRDALAVLPDGEYRATEKLDDGADLSATITITGEQAVVDFAGTATEHAGNHNATPAIVHSVLIYVLRLLVNEPLPLNEGFLEPVEIRIPSGLLDPSFPDDPAHAPAVVGGNVETSQRLVDTLLKALRLCAASQGTMNNVLFGDDRFSYYETVCGGCGAGPGFAGASGVHSHMTNTRITDPELLELRYPVRLDRFGLRRDSGGAGRWPGGDGVERYLTFLAPLELSILSQRRESGPYGMDGGEPGLPGCQLLVRVDGTREYLDGCDSCQVAPGDRLELETPGGGGYGALEAEPEADRAEDDS